VEGEHRNVVGWRGEEEVGGYLIEECFETGRRIHKGHDSWVVEEEVEQVEDHEEGNDFDTLVVWYFDSEDMVDKLRSKEEWVEAELLV